MQLDDPRDVLASSDVERRSEATSRRTRTDLLELDAIAWNLPRAEPARFPPDTAWPGETDEVRDEDAS